MTTVDTRSAIIDTVRDYFEGWYDGDAARMERALHPGLAKRSPEGESLDETPAAWMIDATAHGRGKRDDPDERKIEIAVVDVYDRIATVTVRGPAAPWARGRTAAKERVCSCVHSSTPDPRIISDAGARSESRCGRCGPRP